MERCEASSRTCVVPEVAFTGKDFANEILFLVSIVSQRKKFLACIHASHRSEASPKALNLLLRPSDVALLQIH